MASRAYAYKAQENSSIRTFVLYFQAPLSSPWGHHGPRDDHPDLLSRSLRAIKGGSSGSDTPRVMHLAWSFEQGPGQSPRLAVLPSQPTSLSCKLESEMSEVGPRSHREKLDQSSIPASLLTLHPSASLPLEDTDEN